MEWDRIQICVVLYHARSTLVMQYTVMIERQRWVAGHAVQLKTKM